jgi:ABC-type glycerol-3-phosphate transport system permease component
VTRHPKLVSLAAGLIALAALIVILFPLYAVVVASFENTSQLIGNHYYFFPGRLRPGRAHRQ